MDGLDKEKTLKYSYFRYIALLSQYLFSKDIYEMFIIQISEKFIITVEEEDDIKGFFLINLYLIENMMILLPIY